MYGNGEQRRKVKAVEARLKMLGVQWEAVLEVRGLSQSLDDVLDDPHPDVSGLDFLLRTLDLEFDLSRDQPLEVPQKLLILDVADPAVDRREFVRAGDRRRRGRRAGGAEGGRGNRRKRQWQSKEGRIKVDVLDIKSHTRVPNALSASLDSVPPGIDNLGKNRLSLG